MTSMRALWWNFGLTLILSFGLCATMAMAAIPGDVDGDGDVDNADKRIVQNDLGRRVAQSACGAICDLNGDGRITGRDVSQLVQNCTTHACQENTAPTLAAQVFSVDENSPNGTAVGTVVASGPEAGDVITFAVVGGTGSSAFATGASTGEITVADSAQLDFETTPSFSLDVKATDQVGLRTTFLLMESSP